METWEIDLERLTLNDMILLENAGSGSVSADELKAFLGRFVSNKTEEEIGLVPFPELLEHLTEIGRQIKELVPKRNATP